MELVNPALTATSIPVLNREQVFNASGTFTPDKSGNYLVICKGGGAGGSHGGYIDALIAERGSGGKGGTEGEITQAIVSLTAGTDYSVTIGAGGAGGAGTATYDTNQSSAGVDTTFGTIVTGSGGLGVYGTSSVFAAHGYGEGGNNGIGPGGGLGAISVSSIGNGNTGSDAVANSGSGGGGGSGAFGDATNTYVGGAGGVGGSGYCLITW